MDPELQRRHRRTALAAALLLLGAFGVTGADLHRVAHPWGGEGHAAELAVAARHAREAEHLEPSRIEARPACFVCVLDKPPVGAVPLQADPGAKPEDRGGARCARRATPDEHQDRLPSPRAPPFA